MTQSSSPDNGMEVLEKTQKESQSSFSRLFSRFLLAFFVVQVVVGGAVIIFVIGSEMSAMQKEGVRKELESHRHVVESYLENRVSFLAEYAKAPALVAGVLNPDDQLANTVDQLESLAMMNKSVRFALQDFQGSIVYSNWLFRNDTPSADFQRLMQGDQDHTVTIIEAREGAVEGWYWKISVPVFYHDQPEGVLSAYIPIHLQDIMGTNGENLRLTLKFADSAVVSYGTAEEPVVSMETTTVYPEITLQQEVSQAVVYNRLKYLITVLTLSFIGCTGMVLFVVHRMGKQMLLVPHERLETLRDELEKEVEAQTADLKMRTVQLSIEIRERREAEIEARETGQLVSALLEGIGAGFYIINPKTQQIIRSNAVIHKLFGLSPWQLSQRECTEAFGNYSQTMIGLACPETVSSETYMEGVARHVDGHSFPIARYLVPVEIRGEEHVGVIVLDITDRKNLERRLNVAQKLESIGELASGIAHEINTPIQYVGDSIRFVQEAAEDIISILEAEGKLIARCREDGKYPDLIEEIEESWDDADLEFIVEEIPKACTRALEGTDRVAVIVRAMKNFAHPGTEGMSSLDVNDSLENTILVSKNEWKYVAEIEKDFEFVPTVKCMPGDINQVFLNVLVNAAHAVGDVVKNSGDKGTITLSTREEGDMVLISISDTGTGIPEAIREKIFDPFFTTKEVGRGTGQGLAIVHDIVVERHGGSIDIETEEGKGTTFKIRLPANK
ncbi:PAS sensor protein [Pseudodesulfovibrio profundus]|uniref:histidine kinase n=1 Tax=Pseudodesulfovibrio profundus TaxID=57320 RepID=A0A2C8F9S6_9BACT|nr:ATP-binding protein [Pseudodesulfovibrio profundus]SOB59173.1 PAS sensor protein [Pseudodesulfovibrio profundus]